MKSKALGLSLLASIAFVAVFVGTTLASEYISYPWNAAILLGIMATGMTILLYPPIKLGLDLNTKEKKAMQGEEALMEAEEDLKELANRWEQQLRESSPEEELEAIKNRAFGAYAALNSTGFHAEAVHFKTLASREAPLEEEQSPKSSTTGN